MKKMLFVMIGLASLTSCMDCVEGVGSSIEERRMMKVFDGMVLECAADVIIHQNMIQEANYVVVRAQENLLPMIITELHGSTLKIDIPECVTSTDRLEVEVYSNGLKKIELDGSGSIDSATKLRSKELKLVLDGSGDMELDLAVEVLNASLDGSGKMTLVGDGTKASLELDGSGDMDAGKLKLNSADVSNDGSGSVTVFVKESLEISLTGSGDIRYKGDPQNIDQRNDGSGVVKRLD